MASRTLNIAAAVIHAAQAVAVAVVLASLPPVLLPVTAAFGGGILVAEVNVGTAAVALLGFSAIARAFAATERWQLTLRWVEYSQVSAVTLFLVAQLNGIRDIAALVPIYAITAGVVLFLVLQDRGASLVPFSFAVMLGIVPWGVVAFYQIGASVVGDGPTALVRVITVGLLLVAASYWFMVRRAHVRRHPLLGERSHIVLVLVSNSFLAWMIVIGAAPQAYP